MKKVLGLIFSIWISMTACDPGPAIDVLDNIPVIESNTPAWQETNRAFNFTAQVTQASGEPILDSDRLSVIARFRRVRHPDQNPGPFQVITAHRSNANPNRFIADATDFAPFPNSQSIEFFWVVELTQDSGNIVRLAETEIQRFQIGCPGGQQVTEILNDQNLVRSQFGGLDTIDEISSAGYIKTHNNIVFRGLGVAYVRANVILDSANHKPELHHPDLLLFKPRQATGGQDAVDEHPDEPYELIGWAYTAPLGSEPGGGDLRDTPESPFTIDKRPQLGCIPYEAWFLHEAGWHLLDGGFDVDETPGTELFEPAGIYHKRLWDVHFWLTTSGENQIPRLTIFNQQPGIGTSPNFGADFPPNGFLVPEMQ